MFGVFGMALRFPLPAVAAVCDRRKTALIERRYNSNFEILRHHPPAFA
jgi:hypothetical protein